jgi:hypothetical protein
MAYLADLLRHMTTADDPGHREKRIVLTTTDSAVS